MEMKPSFDLETVYVQLLDGPAVARVEVSPEFWQEIGNRPELHDGRLVGVFPYTEDWKTWEMHPAGDELVYLLSGEVNLILDDGGSGKRIHMGAGTACLVPRGTWHRAEVRKPGRALHITRGKGTAHRPLE